MGQLDMANSLTDFLHARIAEDEAAMERRATSPHAIHRTDAYGTFNPNCPDCLGLPAKARFMAECAAKRAIVEMHCPIRDDGWKSGAAHDNLWCGMCGSIDDSPEPYPCGTLEALAAVYAGHSDYLPEWSVA